MKRFITLFAVLMTVVGVQAEPISLNAARKLASTYVKPGASPKCVARRAQANVEAEFQPIYVFSRGAGEGFVLVSGDDRLPAIIGYTESGDFDEENLPIQLRDMIDYYTRAAQQLQSETGSEAAKVQRRAAGTQDIAPLMSSHHHQSWPYNNLCPYLKGTTNRAATGCVATAASQILYYWRKDLGDRTKYNTPTYSYGDAPVTESIPSGTPLKWDLMKDSYSSGDLAEAQNAIATLVACVGTSAWLTYGSSTSGQIDNCRNVFSSQFGMNGGTTVWRGSYSQSSWEKMIISDLELGRPILYSGVHESNGGHAVVVDGYRLSDNLFHFNFGWGGQGDGYYTVDTETGMNGFNDSQGMVYKIYPATLNIEGQLSAPAETYISRVYNTIKAKITNNSTLPISGFSLYCIAGTTPTGTPQDTETETIVDVGETVELSFEFNPSGTSNYNLILTNANKQVLDKITGINVIASVPDLTLNSMKIDDGGTSESLTVGEEEVEVKHIYNTKKVDVTANFTNGEEGTLCMPTVQGMLKVLKDGEFVDVTTKTKKNVTFEVGTTDDIVYDLTGLDDGEIYRFSLLGVARTNKAFDLKYATNDTVLYFKMMGQNLEITKVEGSNEAKVSGNYNAMAFTSMADDETICRYDMTEVTGVQAPITAANKNALFYVNAEAGVAGTNIIVDGVTASLDLTPGYDFEPREDFHAMQATYHATQAEGEFGTMLLPFDAETPKGMFARKVNEVRNSYLQSVDSCNLTLKSGTPYIILTGAPVDVTAADVAVSINVPSEGTDTLRGTWKNIEATETQYVLDDAETQYFNTCTGEEIPALTAYLEYTKKVRATSYEYSLKDKKALALAQAIRDALNTYKYYSPETSQDAKDNLLAVLDVASDTLRTQPIAKFQTEQIKAIESAVESYLASIPERQDNDYVADMSGCIQNPSFEVGSLKSWEKTSASLNRTTTSATTYMSGADGTCLARVNKGGNLYQTIENLENGVYRLEVLVAADYGNHIKVYAGEQSEEVETTDFGPMYFMNYALEDIKVTDNTLTIGVEAVEDWVKVDNFRLYLLESTDAIECIPAVEASQTILTGVYDLSGRQLNAKNLQKGFYIINGKKTIIK